MKITSIEGNTQRLDGGAMFGNAPKAMWERWLTPDERNRVPLACRSMHVERNGKHYLFDVGVGAFFDPKMRDRFGVVEAEHVLLANLEKVGLSDSDIDGIILSHMHFDHAGGLLSVFGDGQQRLLFPNATIYSSKPHWERATNPHPRDRASFVPAIQTLLQESGRLVLIEDESHPDLDFLRFRYVNGHTPGLMLAELETESGPLVFTADLIPGLPWMHVPITMGYDRFPELSVDEKRTLLEEMLERGGSLFFTHDPLTPMAKVTQNDKGKFIGLPLIEAH